MNGKGKSIEGQEGMRPLCECGCGYEVSLMPHSCRKRGMVKGQPYRFIHGHNAGKSEHEEYEVRDCGFDSPCWLWLGATNNDGRYGRKKGAGKMTAAHRVYYERYVGPVPEGLQLDHLCCQTLCVNPAHLEAVTATENVRRACRLTPEDVAEIRSARKLLMQGRTRVPAGSRQALAARFGVDVKTIRNIWTGATWGAE